jgi:hypothetical protein
LFAVSAKYDFRHFNISFKTRIFGFASLGVYGP